MTGAELIAEERARQISAEGWTPEHDDTHADGEMVCAAICYATPRRRREYEPREMSEDQSISFSERIKNVPKLWPWHPSWWKSSRDRVRELTKAGALIAAEIDRLQREDARKAIPPGYRVTSLASEMSAGALESGAATELIRMKPTDDAAPAPAPPSTAKGSGQ